MQPGQGMRDAATASPCAVGRQVFDSYAGNQQKLTKKTKELQNNATQPCKPLLIIASVNGRRSEQLLDIFWWPAEHSTIAANDNRSLD
jgi:hypothetical protein